MYDDVYQVPTPPPGREPRSPLRLFLLLIAILIVVGAASAAIYVKRQSDNKTPRVVPIAKPTGKQTTATAIDAPPDPYTGPPIVHILLIGSDQRPGESTGRSDTLVLLRLNHTKHTITLLPLPRDLKVNIPGHGTNKINAAYSLGGIRTTIETVREDFGVKINHYAIVDFRGFRDLVDRVGGVYMPIDEHYFNKHDGTEAHNYAELDLPVGYQKLSGEDALSFVRYRHTDDDFVRSARQALFLLLLKQSVADNQDLGVLSDLVTIAKDHVTTDITKPTDLVGLFWAISQVPGNNITRVQLKTTYNADGSLAVSAADEQQALQAWMNTTDTSQVDPKTGLDTTTAEGTTTDPAPDNNTIQTTDVSLVADTTLVAKLKTTPWCVPTRKVVGATLNQARSYQLNGFPAFAASMKLSSGAGKYYLWNQTAWTTPPILDLPHTQTTVEGHTYQLYHWGGHLQIVATELATGWAWIENDLQGDLSDTQMLGLATSCTLK